MKNNQNESLAWLYQELLDSLMLPPACDLSQSSLDSESVSRLSLERSTPLAGTSSWDALVDEDEDEDEDWHPTTSTTSGESALNPQSFAKGDLPTVQQHFQTVLRNRIHTEMQKRPPRFPWEWTVAIEDLDYQDDFQAEVLGHQRAWLPQLSQLLPTHIPETVLLELFAACSQTVGSVHPQSRKMVDAVKSLFPDYWATLNEVINRIRLSPSLSGARDTAQAQAETQRLAQVLPPNYQQASLEQQMAIAVILAKTMLDQLTLQLSPYRPQQTCTWHSTAGDIQIAAQLQRDPRTAATLRTSFPLAVRVGLPLGGTLALKTPTETLTAARANAGELSVYFPHATWGQTYVLTVQLHSAAASPLQLAIRC